MNILIDAFYLNACSLSQCKTYIYILYPVPPQNMCGFLNQKFVAEQPKPTQYLPDLFGKNPKLAQY